MKKLTSFIVLLTALLLNTGCMSATYAKPKHEDKKENYTLVVDKSFDQVWKELITYSASTFFAIDNYEKDSGLVTLTFGADKPSEFITGGKWKSKGSISFDGDYVDYLSLYQGGNLTGKMNIVVSKITDDKTQIQVNARYIYATPPRQYAVPMTWSFDTGRCTTMRTSNPARGTDPERTMCPTYKAENAIINAVN